MEKGGAMPEKRKEKQSTKSVYEERGDPKADAKCVWICGSLSDLHSADAQYHYNFFTQFTGAQNIAAAKCTSKTDKQQQQVIMYFGA